MDMPPLQPPPPVLLTGDEPISTTGLTVRHFWAWALSDLRTNTVRPMLAEFLVARALGATASTRVEWDAYDVRTPEGVTVEVKSGAYLQAWEQARPSAVRFGGLAGRVWTADGRRSAVASYNADVYVFVVVTATDHASYDPLDLAQWSFWVLPRAVVAATGQASLGLARVEALAGPSVGHGDLRAAVAAAAGRASGGGVDNG